MEVKNMFSSFLRFAKTPYDLIKTRLVLYALCCIPGMLYTLCCIYVYRKCVCNMEVSNSMFMALCMIRTQYKRLSLYIHTKDTC